MERERRRSAREEDGERETVGEGVREVCGDGEAAVRVEAARLRVAMAAALGEGEPASLGGGGGGAGSIGVCGKRVGGASARPGRESRLKQSRWVCS